MNLHSDVSIYNPYDFLFLYPMNYFSNQVPCLQDKRNFTRHCKPGLQPHHPLRAPNKAKAGSGTVNQECFVLQAHCSYYLVLGTNTPREDVEANIPTEAQTNWKMTLISAQQEMFFTSGKCNCYQCQQVKKGQRKQLILFNGEQRIPYAAVGPVADKKTLLHQILNAEQKSRNSSLHTASCNSVLHYFPNTAVRTW